MNKQQLFAFLSDKITSTECTVGKQMFATSGRTVIARGTSHCMESCDHEEADTRMLVHLQDALTTGSTTCLVRIVDTDVVIIIIGKFHALTANHPSAYNGLPLALVRTSCISTSIPSAMPWEETDQWHSHFSLLYWLLYNLIFLGKRKKVSMGSLESLHRGN